MTRRLFGDAPNRYTQSGRAGPPETTRDTGKDSPQRVYSSDYNQPNRTTKNTDTSTADNYRIGRNDSDLRYMLSMLGDNNSGHKLEQERESDRSVHSQLSFLTSTIEIADAEKRNWNHRSPRRFDFKSNIPGEGAYTMLGNRGESPLEYSLSSSRRPAVQNMANGNASEIEGFASPLYGQNIESGNFYNEALRRLISSNANQNDAQSQIKYEIPGETQCEVQFGNDCYSDGPYGGTRSGKIFNRLSNIQRSFRYLCLYVHDLTSKLSTDPYFIGMVNNLNKKLTDSIWALNTSPEDKSFYKECELHYRRVYKDRSLVSFYKNKYQVYYDENKDVEPVKHLAKITTSTNRKSS